MSTLALPNAIINGAAGDATKVQQNFDAIVTDSNTNLIKKDGSLAMTAALTLVSADPTLADHASRKSYVDAKSVADVAAEAVIRAAADTNPARAGLSIARAAAQSYLTTVLAAINWDTENYDTAAYFAPTNTNIAMPAGANGLYLITAQVVTAGNNVGSSAQLMLDGVSQNEFINSGLSQISGNSYLGLSTLLIVGTASVLSVNYKNNNAGTVNVTAKFDMRRVSV